ncbi:Stk1 family PASTA domain-containing Ser/Thr kinase [Brachybacterium sp. p3-SID957]|uniref:Stk1 family PASTA domain-containing Ser/Thr kinase n=1 Tax=Brachybacterium sp. p3-SID957 TaxID=2916049 RepID=UPI00223AAB1F|nr:Stk1 family PASTA domain-containing Ser/Thr kinase [Brachybacterium sp. p3-SID957]MCT1775821.1 Stk1 family PASTA domain-containing Ser/Thr kinase [Brachybacterium sp. p3-SID957]
MVLGGRYTLGRVLGHGGMAEVFLAEDTRLHRTVAVKVLRSDLARDDSFQERFRREAQSAASLNHPSIVAVYDTGEEHSTSLTGAEVTIPYIVMEYVEGSTLRAFIDPEDPMDVAQASEVMAALLSALEYSHRAGIVHRDIKPGNVMITESGQVKVMDFGIARAVADATSAMTATQAVMGTAQYLSPEQARGQIVDARSDIYSAACVMYEMLTGRPPFTGDTPVSIAYQHVREIPHAPSHFNPAITPEMDAVILTGLAKDREQRYASAVAFARDIAAVVSGRAPVLVAGAVPAGADAEATTVLTPMDDTTEALPVMTGAGIAGAGAVGAAAAGPVHGSALASAQTGPITAQNGAVVPSGPGEVEEERKRRTPWWLIALVLLAVAGIVAALLWFLDPFGSDGPETVAVPAVVGETEDEALGLLEDVGLKGEVDYQNSAEVDEGTVISSDPAPEAQAPVDSTVVLTVSSGPQAVEVPDLRGKSREEARAELEALGLTMAVAAEEDAAKLEAGQIIRSSPQAGSTAQPGDEVQVWVATGNVVMPNLDGLNIEEATQMLEDLGLTADTTTREDTENAPGTVLEQSVAPGQTVGIGTAVTLVVASEAGPVAVPNVVGSTYEEAQQILQDAGGFGANPQREYHDSVPEGSVIRTEPAAQEQVERGSTITVVISRGPEPTPEPTTDPGPTTDPEPTEEPSPTDDPGDDPPTDSADDNSKGGDNPNSNKGGDNPNSGPGNNSGRGNGRGNGG